MEKIAEYIAELQQHLSTKEAREHTYRPAVERLFASFTDVLAANDQARTEHGATDFVFRKKSNTNIILGYAEAKDIDANLDKTEKTEQMARYAGYDNLILTNYREFRFYQNGRCYTKVEIASLKGFQLSSIPENFQALEDELKSFFELPPEKIKSAKRLSEIMGAKARRIRANIEILLDKNQADQAKPTDITKIYDLMRQMLVHDMSARDFADMYAQTLVYGLFVARYADHTPETFSRQEARDLVPVSNPFLRHFFDHIAGTSFEHRLAVIVDELCQVFQVSDVSGIIDKYLQTEGNSKQGKDPVIHFYEDFLREYDPAERKKMGAYYTPTPVVDYMVRAVDNVLKEHFGIVRGLADSETITKKVTVQGKQVNRTFHRVEVLDPATGTGTFLNEIIKFVHSTFVGQEGMWASYAKEHLIPRLSGFELMMGAYTISHLKLGLTLKNLGVEDLGERLGVYLTNSLEEGVPRQDTLFTMGLSEAVTGEAQAAARIKSERPIMVVVGNPPYSGVSSNETEYANSLISKYKVEPGGKMKLQERKHWLNDDYVKFLAFGEDMIARNDEGILAFITNHGYLDNPTFRGMRWHLVQTFDHIDIIDLHGNSKKKETVPGGGKDENVFDIQQGVAIIVATKLKGNHKKDAIVRSADIYGTRAHKFEALNASELKFKVLKLDKELYYFVDKNINGKAEYEKGFAVNELFRLNNTGMVTAMDKLVIHDSPETAKVSAQKILNSSDPYTEFGIKDWRRFTKEQRLEEFRNVVVTSEPMRVAYRPFDDRYMYFSREAERWINSPRYDVMCHYLRGENIGLLTTKNVRDSKYRHSFLTNSISEVIYLSPTTATNAINFPLWLYDEQGNRTSNLDTDIVTAIRKKVGEVDEQAIFDYIYGVLHWPAYREKYKEFLKIDFPRVPYPQDAKEFERFRSAGERLRELHLMKDSAVGDLITTYPIAGNNEIVRSLTTKSPGWVAHGNNQNMGDVWINEAQYFGNIPKIAWEFYIGGYQPAQKWLKDRKGRTLSFDDITHYQKIIKVLTETDRVMKSL